MAFRWGERNCSQQPFQTTTRGLFSITKFDALRFSAQLRLASRWLVASARAGKTSRPSREVQVTAVRRGSLKGAWLHMVRGPGGGRLDVPLDSGAGVRGRQRA